MRPMEFSPWGFFWNINTMIYDVAKKYSEFINRREYVAAEFVFVYILFPILILLGIPKLVAFMIGLFYTGLIYPSIPIPIRKPNFTEMLKRFLFLMSIAFILLLVLDNGFKTLIIQYDLYKFIWLIPFYPIFSVIPQEFIYRRFFFERYSKYLPPRLLFFTNILFFSYAHICCGNIYAIALTIIAGIVFAETYLRTRNFWIVCLEHAIYGLFVFGMGWGYYFS
jgi:membrane protease YdiL (CAAX protease family)